MISKYPVLQSYSMNPAGQYLYYYFPQLVILLMAITPEKFSTVDAIVTQVFNFFMCQKMLCFLFYESSGIRQHNS